MSNSEDPNHEPLSRRKRTESFYEDNPTYISSASDEHFFRHSTPQAQHLDADALDDAAKALSKQRSALSLLVIRNDYLVMEKYFHGSQVKHSNNVHSASKSILSALVGIALHRHILRSLDQTLGELLPNHRMKDAATAGITLRDLLTMTAGFDWTEDDTEYSIQQKPNWVQAILDLPIANTPGTKFNYCTGNTHLLSAILTEATGESTPEFANDVLFSPLGMTFEHWGKDPQGIASGGYNFYITARALARFANMVYNHGRIDGRQIVPAEWLARSVQPEGPGDIGYPYGFLYWLPSVDGHDIAKMWGFGGQFAYLIPDARMIIVMTNDTAHDYPEPDGDTFVQQYILPAIRE